MCWEFHYISQQIKTLFLYYSELIIGWIEPWIEPFSPAITLTRFENTLIRSVLILSVSFLENLYENKYFAKARWPVKLSVQYDQSERERAGSIDDHAGQEFNSVANTLVRFGLLTHFIYSGSESLWNQSQFNEHKSEKNNNNNNILTFSTNAFKPPQNPSTQRHEGSERIAKEHMCARYRLLIGWQQSPKSNTSFH